MKPLVDDLLRLNTEEGHLVSFEAELEAFGNPLHMHALRVNYGMISSLVPSVTRLNLF